MKEKSTSYMYRAADLLSKHRSTLHVIQLAKLPKVSDIERFGNEKALGSLLKDCLTLYSLSLGGV